MHKHVTAWVTIQGTTVTKYKMTTAAHNSYSQTNTFVPAAVSAPSLHAHSSHTLHHRNYEAYIVDLRGGQAKRTTFEFHADGVW